MLAHERDEEAAAWVARRDAGRLAPSEELELNAWLDADTRNRVAYLRLQAAWRTADRLAGEDVVPALPGPGRPSSRRWMLYAPLSAAAALAACVALAVALPTVGARLSSELMETPLGGRASTPLADGSKIELNTDTRVRVAVQGRERRVWLDRGEVFFDVSRDVDRPFTVIAGASRVVVEGTKFTAFRQEDTVIVRVASGRVRVELDDRKTRVVRTLGPGDEASITRGRLMLAHRGVTAVMDELSWREGRLQFVDTTLADAAEAFNRYNSVRLVIVSPVVASMRIGGAFDADNAEGFAEVLRDSYGLDVDYDEGQIIIGKSDTGY